MYKSTELVEDTPDEFDAASISAVKATRQLVVEIHSSFTLVQLEVISIVTGSVNAGSVCHRQALTAMHELSSGFATLSHEAVNAVKVFREHVAKVNKLRVASGDA